MNKGLFEPTVMFFGLCNSPSTFQNMMNNIFKDKINERWLLIYMDDILIFTNDHSKMEEYTKKVLQKLHNNDLFLNLDKCVFDITEVEYLGLIIKENEIAMEPPESHIGLPPLPSNKSNHSSDLRTSTGDSLESLPTSPYH